MRLSQAALLQICGNSVRSGLSINCAFGVTETTVFANLDGRYCKTFPNSNYIVAVVDGHYWVILLEYGFRYLFFRLSVGTEILVAA